MWQKKIEMIKVGKILVSWNFLCFLYQMSPSLQLTNPPRCVIVQKEGNFQTLHFQNFLPKSLNKWLSIHQRGRWRGRRKGRHTNTKDIHKNAVLLTPGLGLKLTPCPLPVEGWDTELPFTLPQVPLHSSEMAAQLSPVKRTALWSLEPVPTITNNEAFSLW